MTSPTQRTLAYCRSRGWLAAVVERWNPHAHIRQDLFGFVDVLAVTVYGKTVAIQTTTTGTAERKKKIDELPQIGDLLRAGWMIEVWGWRKINGRKKGARKTWALKRELMMGPGTWELLEEAE